MPRRVSEIPGELSERPDGLNERPDEVRERPDELGERPDALVELPEERSARLGEFSKLISASDELRGDHCALEGDFGNL